MLLGLWVTVLFGHAEVNQVDVVCVGLTGPSNQEVVRLNVTIDEVVGVQVFDQSNHLHSHLNDGFRGKFPPAPIE